MHPYRESSVPKQKALRVGENVQVAHDARTHANEFGVIWFLSGPVHVVRFRDRSCGFYFREQLDLVL